MLEKKAVSSIRGDLFSIIIFCENLKKMFLQHFNNKREELLERKKIYTPLAFLFNDIVIRKIQEVFAKEPLKLQLDVINCYMQK